MRWSQIVNHWEELGYKIYIITASLSENKEISANSHILRVKENLFGQLRHRLGKKSSIDNKTISLEEEKKGLLRMVKKVISYIYRVFIRNLQWPDYAWTWISKAYRETNRLIKEEGPFDVMISVSHPFSSHLVAKRAKAKNPEIRWIADNGDPFSFLKESQPNNFDLYKNLNFTKEEEVFQCSDYASVTTNETKKVYKNLFSNIENKIKVIPPLIDEELLNYIKRNGIKHRENTKLLNLVFTGTLYSKIRNPVFLLDLLEEVNRIIPNKIAMNFYGLTNDFDIRDLKPYNYPIIFHGEVEKSQIIRQQISADVLVNIGNSTHYQLPSKIVDYALTGKPILNISSLKNDSSSNFLNSYPNSKTVCLTDILDEKKVSEVASFLNNRQILPLNEVLGIVESNRVEVVSRAYRDLLT